MTARALDVAPTTIVDLLESAVARFADQPAILVDDRPPLPYRALDASVEALRDALCEAGIGRGDRVLGALAEPARSAVAFLGAAGVATYAALDPSEKDEAVERIAAQLRASAAIVASDEASPLRALAERAGIPLLEIAPPSEASGGRCEIRLSRERRRAPWRRPTVDDEALLLRTSGTTGGPKWVPLTHARMTIAVLRNVAALQLSADDRCLSLYPLFHAGGLLRGVLMTIAAGECTIHAPQADAATFYRLLDRHRPRWYMAPPATHQAILRRAPLESDVIARSSLRFIRSGAAALPLGVQRRLEETFGVPVIQTYATSETLNVTTEGLQPSERRTGSVGRSMGNEIAILGTDGRPLPTGAHGEIVVRGATVTPGYVDGDPEDETPLPDGWRRTGDLGYLDDDGFLFIVGRRKEMVNRGGVSIAPTEIDEALLEHPAVAEAAAFGIPDERLGEDVAAAVVLAPGHTVAEAELKAFVAKRLSDLKVPRRIAFLDALPKGSTGKVLRRALAQAAPAGFFASEPDPGGDPAPEMQALVARVWSEVLDRAIEDRKRTFFELGGNSLSATRVVARLRELLKIEIPLFRFFESPTIAGIARAAEELFRRRTPTSILEDELAHLWATTLGVASVGRDDDFVALGGNPQLAATLVDRIEEALGRRLPASAVLEHRSVGALAAILKGTPERFLRLNASGTQRPFFFLHGDLHGAGLYCRLLAQALGDDQPLLLLAPHGSDGTPVPATIEAMAEDYLALIRREHPAGPYRLGGYCNGGIVALDIARRLEEAGEAVELLVEVAPFELPSRALTLRRFARAVGFSSSAQQQIVRRWRRVRRERNGADENVLTRRLSTLMLDEAMFQLGRAIGNALELYVPYRHHGPVRVLVPEEDAPDREALATRRSSWRAFCDDVEVATIPGGHITCVSRYGGEIGAAIAELIASTEEEERAG